MQRSEVVDEPDEIRPNEALSIGNGFTSASSTARRLGPRALDRPGPVDITREFIEAARALPDGKVYMANDIELFDTVGALEIGDAKMDSGLLLPRPLEDPKFEVNRSMSLGELLHVMDLHFNYLMEWHTGMPLAQTLLSSHYVDLLLNDYKSDYADIALPGRSSAGHGTILTSQETTSASSILIKEITKFYCISVLRACDLAIEQVKASFAPFYEDEDISLQTLGRDLLPRIQSTTLEQAASKICRYLRVLYDKELMPIERTRLSAIQDRVLLILGFISLANRDHDVQQRLYSAESMLVTLERIKTEKNLSISVEGVFVPEIQHRIASTSPLRPLPDFNLARAYTTAKNIITGFLQTPSSLEHHKAEPNMHIMKTKSFFTDIVKRNLRRLASRDTSLPFVKAVIFDGLWTESDECFEPLLLQDIKGLLPLECVEKYHQQPNSPASVAISTFCHRALYNPGGYLDYFRALSSNPSRMRRVLGHVVGGFEELEHKEAIEADNAISACSSSAIKTPISTWVRLTKLELMEHVIELGIELDVYHDDDIVFIYGYLLTVTNARMQVIQNLRHVLTAASLQREQTVSTCDIDTIANLEDMTLASEADRIMLQATYAIHQLAQYLEPRTEQYSETVQRRRWDIRTRVFWTVTDPAIPSWEEIQKSCTLFLPEDEMNEKFIDETFAKIIKMFREAELAYKDGRKMSPYNGFAERLEQDELYIPKSRLAKEAHENIESIRTQWQKGIELRFDLKKHVMKTEDGITIIYYIPGLR